ncbi:MAG: DUF58 domain-containing protein [Planctomycetes bacterium]|nr:DUF58 domain-containing protein [Planctomycetota bacterium]
MPLAEVAEVVARYRLDLGSQRFRGRAGERRGHGVGSSQEFFDFRDYAPGDDLRHLDWRAYARTEQLRIRLHQEEVAPHVDLLLDTSASMASTPAKAAAAIGLVHAIRGFGDRQGSRARVLALGGGPVEADVAAFTATAAEPLLPALPLRSAGVRIVLTDGLWSAGSTAFLQRARVGAARFAVLQLLDPWEIEPTADGALTLIDCETGERREIRLDAAAIAGYRARLQRLCDALRGAVVGHGGLYARIAADSLPRMCARDLLPAGILEPR